MENKEGQGICPVCGNNDLEYYGYENETTGLFYRWECNHCHSHGNEWYSLNFIEHEVTFNGEHK